MAKKQVARILVLNSFAEILAEARRISSNPNAKATAKWTPAQNIQHVAKLIQASIEGYPANPPLIIRLIGPLFKQRFIKRTFNPGITLPGNMAAILPDDGVTGEEALALLETMITRGQTEGFLPASPLFGKLSAAQWEQMHCRHAEMHFGMVAMDNAPKDTQ